MSERIEAAVAELMRTVDELSAVVAAQQAAIDALERRVAILIAREADRQADGGGVVIGDERPPHW
ncbi:MAG: SlyX family protein [Gemmobacter sp.]